MLGVGLGLGGFEAGCHQVWRARSVQGCRSLFRKHMEGNKQGTPFLTNLLHGATVLCCKLELVFQPGSRSPEPYYTHSRLAMIDDT